MRNHYEVLGVLRDATPEQIKRAWRVRSSATHPDKHPETHGDGVEQAAVNRAYEVLSDPERRAFYDKHGQERPTETIEEKGRAELARVFAKIIDESEGSIVDKARDFLGIHRDNLAQHLKRIEIASKKLQARSGKVKVKTGDNVVQALIDNNLKMLAEAKLTAEQGLAVNAAAQIALANYEEEAPPPPSDDARAAAQRVEEAMLAAISAMGSTRAGKAFTGNPFTGNWWR